MIGLAPYRVIHHAFSFILFFLSIDVGCGVH